MNVLFVCSKNQWRSPTAETLFRRRAAVSVRSAGTSRSARRSLCVEDLRWADLICVMEDKHLSRMRADFRQELRFKEVHVLHIPDEYRYMDPELIDLITQAVEPLLEAAG